MKDIFKLAGILMLVTVIAGGALSMVNSITKDRIEQNKKEVINNSLRIAIPSADTVIVDEDYQNFKNGDIKLHDSLIAIIPTRLQSLDFYKAYITPDTNTIVGYAFLTERSGYSSIIKTMVGVDTNYSIIGLKVVQQVETPGLGTKIQEVEYGETESWAQKQFKNRRWEELVLNKEGGDIESITGATISSNAVTKSIRYKLHDLEKILEGNK